MIFFIFLIICCSFAYSKSSRLCLVYSFAGRVLWYYATIALCVIGVSFLMVLFIGLCMGDCCSVDTDADNNTEGGSLVEKNDKVDMEKDKENSS